MELYHYRSIESALKEIKNSTFHFASRDELNDPLEGYIRVYWKGDKAAWEGLFKNYVCSVCQTIELYVLAADSDMLHHRSLVLDIHSMDDKPLGKIWEKLAEDFISDSEVSDLVTTYGNLNLKVYRNELILLLRFVHWKALALCIKSNMEHHTMDMETGISLLKYFESDKPVFPTKLIESNLTDEKLRSIITESVERFFKDFTELQIIHMPDMDSFLYGETEEKKLSDSESERARRHRNWLSIVVDFPEIYANQLSDMIYPESYMVCFSGRNDNSAMWGNYADNHKGICLVYETDAECALRVNRSPDMQPEGRGDVQNNINWSNMKLKKVSYGGELLERNFFESFGRMTVKQIKSWLTGSDGISCCYDIIKDIEAWRNNYRMAFEMKNYRKLKAWEHEDEYRLVISNEFHEYETPEKRNLSYDQKALKGVIFGIRTTEFDKKSIVDALMKRKLKDFTFYQAEYDDEKQAITVREKAWKSNRTRDQATETANKSSVKYL